MGTGHGALECYFEKVKILKRNHKCGYGQSKTVRYLLNDRVFCESGREHLRKSLP